MQAYQFFIGPSPFKIDCTGVLIYNMCMKKRLIPVFILISAALPAKEFRYRFEEGSRYKARSVVREQVYLNHNYISDSEILNLFSVEITGVRPDGRGELEARYGVAETIRRPGSAVVLYSTGTAEKNYLSRFCQDRFGAFSEDEDDFMPVVRNVPLFPERDLQPGDQWSAPGYEVHDFRESFGIRDGFRFDTQVSYRYIGETERNGVKVDEIEAVSFASFVPRETAPALPIRVVSQVNQSLYWDNSEGRLSACRENFDILFLFRDGRTWNFKGFSESEIIEVLPMDRKGVVSELKKKLGSDRIGIEEKEEGISLVLNDLRFYPDEDRLLPGEESKLDEIAEALKQIPGYDIRVIGHTAEAGNAKMRLQLSLDRAGRVAEELIRRKARSAEQILVEGKGSEEPVASNDTEEGRRLNRRVEIIIVDEYNRGNGNK